MLAVFAAFSLIICRKIQFNFLIKISTVNLQFSRQIKEKGCLLMLKVHLIEFNLEYGSGRGEGNFFFHLFNYFFLLRNVMSFCIYITTITHHLSKKSKGNPVMPFCIYITTSPMFFSKTFTCKFQLKTIWSLTPLDFFWSHHLHTTCLKFLSCATFMCFLLILSFKKIVAIWPLISETVFFFLF